MAAFLATTGRFRPSPEPSVAAASSLMASAHCKLSVSLLNRVASEVNLSVSPDLSSLMSWNSSTSPGCRTTWRPCNRGRGSSMRIEARAGGYRPPSGARRPRSNYNRQQQGDDDGARDRLPVNDEISAPTVMLLGEDGKLVGTMSRQEALYRAREQELDLVQLDKQDPPCVKIVQYSKLKYELQKRKKEQQKKSSANKMDLKELKMRYNIDVHDYAVRLRSAQRFLKDGDKVKLIIQFKGRELEFKELGLKLFERFEEDLKEEAVVESKLTKDLRSMTMVLTPNKGKISGQTQAAVKTPDTEAAAAATTE